jgi:hypothetical protein
LDACEDEPLVFVGQEAGGEVRARYAGNDSYSGKEKEADETLVDRQLAKLPAKNPLFLPCFQYQSLFRCTMIAIVAVLLCRSVSYSFASSRSV